MTDLSKDRLGLNILDADTFVDVWNSDRVRKFSDDFLAGQRDAKAGREPKAGKSDWYDRGYATQYESEQIASEHQRKSK